MRDDWFPVIISTLILYISTVTGTESLYRDLWWRYDGVAGIGYQSDNDISRLPEAVPRGSFKPVCCPGGDPTMIVFDLETTDLRPDLWNRKWPICGNGKYQSPIDIKPDRLLYDPQLTGIIFSNDRKINGNVTNTGNDITIFIDDTLVPYLTATNGPLQYTYNLHQIKLHFGRDDDSGSEHTINALSFPAEIQILAYNKDLYSNYSQALSSPYGIAAFSIFLEIGDTANEAYSMIDEALQDLPSKDYRASISGLPLNILLPNTPQYITYEGSLTQPGCQETVTWVIFNKPIYTTKEQINRLRNINTGEDGEYLLLFGNIRPSMPVNNRLIRTNISYRPRTKACSMAKEVFYEVNTIKPRRSR